METRRNELLAVQEAIASAKNLECVGSTFDVLIDGAAEEEGYWLEGRHEGLAPDIDGVVYIDHAGMGSRRPGRPRAGPSPGEIVKVTITDAAMYDLVGNLAGETSSSQVRPSEMRQPRGDYR
jgi:ribosomal protein S12 methylthiotransferase